MIAAAVQTPLASQRPRAILPRRAHLGLDLGTHMGYAALDDRGAVICSGTWNFSPTERERRQNPGQRWVRVGNQIGEWFASLRRAGHTFNSVAYEKVIGHLGMQAAHVYGGMEAFVQAQAARFDLALQLVTVSQLKRIATSAGGGHRADKQHIMAAARAKWPHLDIDRPHADDEADALWIAEMARRRTLGVVL